MIVPTVKKVLYIEDSPEDRYLLQRHIQSLNLNIEYIEAQNEAEGLEKIKSFAPDCVIVDYFLNDNTAIGLITDLKKLNLYNNLAIVVVTANTNVQIANDCIKNGAHDYLTKSEVSPDTLRRAIGNAIDKVKLRKEVERSSSLAKQNSKMVILGTLTSGIAHEINNPLAILDGHTSLLKKHLEMNNTEKLLSSIEKIKNTSRRIADIVKGLQTFSGEFSHGDAENFSSKEIIQQTIEYSQDNIKKHSIQFTVEESEPPGIIRCNATQVSQILLNLISNSIDAIANNPNPWIQLKSKTENKKVIFSVTDSGKGIPDKIKERLMEPFYTTKSLGKGTGLGLSISKGIAEKFSGSLAIDSKQKNTCFTLELPIIQTTNHEF